MPKIETLVVKVPRRAPPPKGDGRRLFRDDLQQWFNVLGQEGWKPAYETATWMSQDYVFWREVEDG